MLGEERGCLALRRGRDFLGLQLFRAQVVERWFDVETYTEFPFNTSEEA